MLQGSVEYSIAYIGIIGTMALGLFARFLKCIEGTNTRMIFGGRPRKDLR